MANEKGAGRKKLPFKKIPVTLMVFSDKAEAFKKEVQPIADRYNGAEKIIQAQSFAEKAKGKKQARKRRSFDEVLAEKDSKQEYKRHLKEADGPEVQKVYDALFTTHHKLWKPGDPKENTGAFFLKYGAMTYQEINKK